MTAQKRAPRNILAQALEESGAVEILTKLNAQEVKTEGEVTDATPGVDLKKLKAEMYAEIRAEMEAPKDKKPKNKSMTFLITPENAKQLEKMSVKGQKSELVNKLLERFFEND